MEATRRTPQAPPEPRRFWPLERLRRAHLFYPGVQALQQDVQVRCNYVTAGIDEGDFVDAPLHDAIGARVLLSQALEHTGAQRVLVVAGSSS